MKRFFTIIIALFVSVLSFSQTENSNSELVYGNARTEIYLPELKNKKVGLVCNHTSVVCGVVCGKHLADTLLDMGVNLVCLLTPEHGFQGTAKEGQLIENQTSYNGVKVCSLYGKNKKPSKEIMQSLDVILFDLQDVGCRFYTYISTLQYVMQACIENDRKLIVLDRPNPNNYVCGPILEPKFRSFVGLQCVPVCYGLTIGEYAQMINRENWVDTSKFCDLMVVKMQNYRRDSAYVLQIPPSPNLKSAKAVRNYPTLCLFEGTPLSVGRNTPTPFEIIGFYDENKAIKNPEQVDIHQKDLQIEYLIRYYNIYKEKFGENMAKEKFFSRMFLLLSGSEKLKQAIISGKSAEEIRSSWAKDIENYEKIRKKYLIYK